MRQRGMELWKTNKLESNTWVERTVTHFKQIHAPPEDAQPHHSTDGRNI